MTIWIIDDDFIFVKIFAAQIQKIGLEVKISTFKNGKLAWDSLDKVCGSQDSSTMPDLLFLDLNMPVFNGWEFLERCKEKWETEDNSILKKLKLYVVSSSQDSQDIARAKAFEFVSAFFAKPVNIDAVRMILEKG